MLWFGIWTIFNIVSCKSITPITSLSLLFVFFFAFVLCMRANDRRQTIYTYRPFHLKQNMYNYKVEDFLIDGLMIVDD